MTLKKKREIRPKRDSIAMRSHKKWKIAISPIYIIWLLVKIRWDATNSLKIKSLRALHWSPSSYIFRLVQKNRILIVVKVDCLWSRQSIQSDIFIQVSPRGFSLDFIFSLNRVGHWKLISMTKYLIANTQIYTIRFVSSWTTALKLINKVCPVCRIFGEKRVMKYAHIFLWIIPS